MALTVEDGTGMATSDAFVSVAAFKAYCDLLGISYASYTDTQIEQAIRRASNYLTRSINWQGYRVNGRSQALAWPRYDVYDYSDCDVPRDVPSNEVPQEVVDACCVVAVEELATPGAMNPRVVLSKRKSKVSIDGAVSAEYPFASDGAEADRPVLLDLNSLIGRFMERGHGSALAGRAVRV